MRSQASAGAVAAGWQALRPRRGTQCSDRCRSILPFGRTLLAAKVLFGPVARDLELVEEAIAAAAQVEFPALAALLEHILRTRGKRVRPALVLLAATFHDYRIGPLVNLAAAIELLHTATLIHDDIVDEAYTRRGATTLHQLVDSHSAVLVGDYVFAKAAALSSESGDVRVMQVFGKTLMTICDGELRQLLSTADWRQTREQYYQRITSKTASLFQTSAEAGAILSGAPEAEVAAFREFGLCLGLAFQIVDDVLDLVGDEAILGKPVGGDLRHRIVTLPTIWYVENHPGDQTIRALFEELAGIDGATDDSAVDEAIRLIAGSAGIDYSMEVAREFVARAKAAIAWLPATTAREALDGLADYVVDRRF